MPEQPFAPDSKVRDVVQRLGDRGEELLRKHGYDLVLDTGRLGYEATVEIILTALKVRQPIR